MEIKLDGNYTRKLYTVFEQVHEATSDKTAAVWPCTYHLTRQIIHVGYCWWSKEKRWGSVFLWTLIHGKAMVSQPARTYMHQLCVDTGYSLEDLLWVMDDRDGSWERESGNCAISMTWWWWWLCIYVNKKWICYTGQH